MALRGEVITHGSETLDSIEALDVAQGRWHTAGALPQPLHGVPVVAERGKLYVIGGSRYANSVVNDGRVFERQW